jgi:hypothetical protein
MHRKKLHRAMMSRSDRTEKNYGMKLTSGLQRYVRNDACIANYH